jgi:hypothetical protein
MRLSLVDGIKAELGKRQADQSRVAVVGEGGAGDLEGDLINGIGLEQRAGDDQGTHRGWRGWAGEAQVAGMHAVD